MFSTMVISVLRKTGLLLLLASIQMQVRAQTVQAFNYKVEKHGIFREAAVASAHPLASKVGRMILAKGGNAVDAAIAMQWALAVVYPQAGNIGGGGFMVAHLNDGRNLAIDYREMAPAAAYRDMYLDEDGSVNSRKSIDGHLAVGVPGTVAGLFASHRYAKLPMATLIAPAIELAKLGFAVTAAEARGLNALQSRFKQFNTSGNAFIRDVPWQEGDTLVQTDLANTLMRISVAGEKGFYEGETAQLIVAEMQRGHGIITLDDLKNYKAKYRDAIIFPYKGYKVITMPLPSSGGIILQQMMGMVEPYSIGKFKHNSAEAVQLMTEIERRAYADRAAFLGDEDFVNVPVAAITNPGYLTRRMQGYQPGIAGNSEQIQAGQIPDPSEQTTHLNVLDAAGNAVSVTTTLNGSYGSKVVVSRAGFFLNNEMDDFSAKPGVANMYGLVGNEANAIAPGKRMLSSMTPTIVLKENQPYIVTGTPGGSTIITSVFQTLLNVIDFKLDAMETVNAPKFHHQWLPDVIDVEADFPEPVIEALEKMGYKVHKRGAIGRTELIIKHGGNGQIEAVGDKRGDDSVAGI